MASIIVSGGTSFIGKEFIRYCLNNGDRVVALVREQSINKLIEYKDNINFRIIVLDMDEVSSINDVLDDKLYDENQYKKYIDISKKLMSEKYDAIINFAWAGVGKQGRMNSHIQYNNIKNTLALMKLCSKIGCKRFIFAGSQAEYGYVLDEVIDDNKLIDETYETNPKSEYGKAKLEVLKNGIKLADKYDIEYIHMRIFSIYGYNDHETALVPTCIRACLENKALTLSKCSQKWNYLYIKDAVRAIYSLINCNYNNLLTYRKLNSPVINIASDTTKYLYEFVNEIKTSLHSDITIDFSKQNISNEGVPYLTPNIDKLKVVCSFKEEYSFKSGVEEIGQMYSM